MRRKLAQHVGCLTIAAPSCMQVRENVRTALTPLTDKERSILSGVEDILRPVKDVSWPSGLPENN